MLLDFLCSVHTETLGGITSEQAGENATSLRADVVTEDERILQNLLVHLLRVLCTDVSTSMTVKKVKEGLTIVEWRKTRKHLIQQDTKRPPINRLV